MLTEVSKNIFMLDMDMPDTRIKSINQINLYVIKGEDCNRNLLIDTGINQISSMNPLLEIYEQLGITKENTDIFMTHMHPDHCGLVKKLQTPHNRVYANPQEAKRVEMLNDDDYWKNMYGIYSQEGLPMKFDEFKISFPYASNFTEQGTEFTLVTEEDVLSYGGYNFKCIVTPGHSPAHTCLYDSESEILISGDAILKDVVPALFIELEFNNPLNEYLKTLDRIDSLNIKKILSMHGGINFDVGARTNELRKYYENKCDRILEILKRNNKLTAWNVAEIATKDDLSRELASLSSISRWFFFLPAIACLRYLEETGKVLCSTTENGGSIYELSETSAKKINESIINSYTNLTKM